MLDVPTCSPCNQCVPSSKVRDLICFHFFIKLAQCLTRGSLLGKWMTEWIYSSSRPEYSLRDDLLKCWSECITANLSLFHSFYDKTPSYLIELMRLWIIFSYLRFQALSFMISPLERHSDLESKPRRVFAMCCLWDLGLAASFPWNTSLMAVSIRAVTRVVSQHSSSLSIQSRYSRITFPCLLIIRHGHINLCG